MGLETEISTYNDHLPELLSREGQFVLICGEEIVGFYPTYQQSVQEGYKLREGREFLVRQIRRSEELAVIPSMFIPK